MAGIRYLIDTAVLEQPAGLNYDVSVLYGFLGIALAAATIALPLYFISVRKRGPSIVLWLYYSCGFAFLGAVAIHQWEGGFAQKLLAATGLLMVYVLLQFIANRWWNVRRAAPYFAVFAGRLRRR